MITGTAYGVVLNDLKEQERLAGAFDDAPYQAPPSAPVVYIKPRTCFATGGSHVPIPSELEEVTVSATIAFVFARDCGPGDDPATRLGGACLALDVSEPEASYYRPAIRQRCRDGFLPMGAVADWSEAFGTWEIVTELDGSEVHRWSSDRLVRPVERLIRDLADFMTFQSGDLLMIGLAGDAPRARSGQQVRVQCAGLPDLVTRLEKAKA